LLKEEFNNKYYTLLDTLPLIDSDKCYNIRSIANQFRVNKYNQRTSISNNKKYKDFTNLAIENFIKFIKGFKNDYRISKQSLFNLKH